MKVILLQNIKGFGRMGDVKNVTDGYGRNFLLPKRLAKPATLSALKDAEELKKKAGIAMAELQQKAQEIKNKLADAEIEIESKASNTGTLFASITKKDVVIAVEKKYGVKVEEDFLNLGEHGEHIKHLGDHLISLDIEDVVIPIKLHVKESK